MKTTAVVLAAGKSERMGRNKLLLKLDGKRLIDHILDALENSKVDEIFVVLGNKPWEITDAVKSRLNRTRIVVNERPEEEMTSSFKAALKQIQYADAVLLVLGDQLIPDPKFINTLIEEMEEKRGKVLIVSPVYRGKKGHPLLFSKQLFKEILNLKKDETIRDIIHRHSDMLLSLEGEEWTIRDIDTPKDFEEAKRLLEEEYSNLSEK